MAGDGVWDWDLVRNRVDFSPRWKHMLGFEDHEISDSVSEWSDRVHPDDLPTAQNAVREHLDGKTPSYASEHRMRCKDGSWIWILDRGMVTQRDPDGKALRMIGTHVDITQRRGVEEALRISEERYRGVVEDQTETICRYKADGTFTFVNDVYCRLVGKTREELVGQTWFPRAPQEELSSIQSQLAKMSPTHPVVTIVNPIFVADGSLRWFQFVNRGFFDAEGKLTETQVVGRDITEQREVEEALRVSEERWKFALEGAGDGLWDWNIELGQVHYSRRWKEMLGYLDHEVEDTFLEWQKRVHNEDLPGAQVKIAALLEGRTQQLGFEARMLCKNGRWKWILSRGLVTKVGKDGRPLRLIGTHVDITAQKETREREARNLELVAAGAEVNAVIHALIQSLEAEHPDMACCVKLKNRQGDRMELIAAPSFSMGAQRVLGGRLAREGIGCGCLAALSGQRVIIEDLTQIESLKTYKAQLTAHRLRACWAEPIRGTDGQILGALSGYFKESRAPRTAEISSVVNAAQLIGVALERKRAEEALKESEERFRVIFEQAAVGVAMIESKTGRFLTVNQRYCEMLGFSADELVRTTFMAISHPDDLRADLDSMAKMRVGEIRHFSMEKRLVRADGAHIWVNLSVAAMRKPGHPMERHVAVVEDITSRKQAEEALRESEQLNRALLDHTSALIVVTDKVGRITHINQAVTNQFGYTLGDVEFNTPWETGVFNQDETAQSKERFKKLLQGELSPARELKLRDKQGKWHLVETRSTITRAADGTVDRVIITGTDMTERRRLEQEILKISEQEQANIGHNLHDGVGQTLTGIGSLMDSLEASLEGSAKAAAGRIRELMKQAVSEVRRMSHGLSPVAVQHRGLAGGLQLLAETVRTNFRREAVCEIDPGIAIGDGEREAHLFRIAQEAVNNALRHGRCTTIQIVLRRESETVCVLEVIDNGGGFSASQKSLKQGIGLRVMSYRANLIGVELDVKSKPRVGTTVTCRFECPVPLAPKAKKKVSPKTGGSRTKKKTNGA